VAYDKGIAAPDIARNVRREIAEGLFIAGNHTTRVLEFAWLQNYDAGRVEVLVFTSRDRGPTSIAR
jgi:hypothetical protein